MPSSKNLANLVVNKIENKEVWEYMKTNNLINDDELYLIQEDNEGAYEFDIEPVSVPSTGSITVSDSRIKADMTGTFIPDLSVIDLISNISVTCAEGSATITATTSYEIPGVLRLY